MKIFFSLVFFLVFLFSCSNKTSDKILASVYDYELFYDDVIYSLPENISDTNAFLQKYVDDWISEKVLLNQAIINIDVDSEEFETKVDNYKNSLLIFEYQQRLIDQNFDTSVSTNDVINYYNTHIKEFKLEQDIFKGRLIIVDKDAPNLSELIKLFKSNDDSDIDEMISYCLLYAKEYYVNDSAWSYFNPVKSKIPNTMSARNIYYSNRKYEIVAQDNFIYLLFIKEYKFKGEISPFSIEKEKIKNLIINKNKMKYLQKLENVLIQNGKISNDINIYL